MDKSKQLDTSRFTDPLLEHLLAGEIPDHKAFLAHCRKTLPSFIERIDPRFPRSMVNARAYHLWVYVNLKEKLGRDRAYEIMRVVFLEEGITRMNLVFGTVHGRSFEKLISKTTEFSDNLGLLYQITEQSHDRFEINLQSCTFWELCKSLDIPEATTLICQVDNAFFSSYLPDEVRFSRGGPCNRLVDGADSCRMVFTPILGISGPDCDSGTRYEP